MNDEIFIPEIYIPSPEEDAYTSRAWSDLSHEQRQILTHREQFAQHAYGLTQTWTGFLIVITLAQFTLKPLGYGLDKAEFIVVFTTTTASVFGFGILVGKFLFPTPGISNTKKHFKL